MATKTKIVKIGNSQGVRIPKALLEQANLGEEVELEVQEGKVIVRPTGTPRAGWEKDLAEMAQEGEDQLLEGDVLENDFDEHEWEW